METLLYILLVSAYFMYSWEAFTLFPSIFIHDIQTSDLGQNTNFSAIKWKYKIHFSIHNFYGNENTFHKNVKKYKYKYFHFPKLKIQNRISVVSDLSFTPKTLN